MRSRPSLRLAVLLALTSLAAPALRAQEQPQRRLYHILLSSEREAIAVRKEIVAADSTLEAFRAAARKHSKDVTTKPLGGDLGWAGRTGHDANFAYAAWRLKIGAVSRPILSRFGWHLIFAASQRGPIPSDDLVKPKPPKPPEGGFERRSDSKAVRVIDRYLEALGGEAALAAIRDRSTESENVKKTPTGETRARIQLHLKRGSKIRERWSIEGFKIKGQNLEFTQVYNGKKGWVKMTGTVAPLEGRTLSVFVWSKPIDDLFAHWKEDGYRLEHAGNGLVGSEPVELVRALDFSRGGEVLYAFSKKTGLLLKKEWVDTSKGSVRKEQFYKNYRPISFSDKSGHKLQVALRHDIHVEGNLDTTRTLSKVTFNTGLADDFFERPEGPAFAPADQ